MALARCEYIQRRKNVIAVGNSGTGKTHVALVLQRRFPNLIGFRPGIASRKTRAQSYQARGQVDMKRCSRPLSYEPSL